MGEWRAEGESWIVAKSTKFDKSISMPYKGIMHETLEETTRHERSTQEEELDEILEEDFREKERKDFGDALD